ncbi:MAG: cysteine desulfurase family protein [Robiginitomaculum sp.]
MTRIYFDHNATSPMRPEAIDAMNHAFGVVGNSSAPHGNGRSASSLVEQGREDVAMAMGVCAQDLIFTGSGTESDNTAIHCAVHAGCKRILVSSMDHPACASAAEQSGLIVDYIPVNRDGQSDMAWLKSALETWDSNHGRPFVSLCAVNSETGIIQDVETATDLTHAAGGLILIDAVQALGKIMMTYQPDYISVSAHKIGGPQGVGALYVASDAPFTSYLIGGGQEKRRRAGTLNVAGIAGFGAAAKVCEGALSHTGDIRAIIETGLKAMEPELVIFGDGVARIPNTLFFAVPDTASSTLMMALDLAGISVSTGMACSSGKVGASRAITAMGRCDDAPKGCIRVSLGYTTQAQDAQVFLNAWAKIRRKTYGAA